MIQYAVSCSCFGKPSPALREAYAQTDFRTVEISLGMMGPDPEGREWAAFYRDLAKAGLAEIVSAHIPFDRDPSDPDENERRETVRRIAALLRLNADILPPALTLHGGREPIPDCERPVRLDQLRRSIEELIPVARETHSHFHLEFLPRTCIGNKESELLYAVRDFDNADIGVLLDVNHVMDRYAELPAIVRTLGSRLHACHFSDYDGRDEKHWHIGEGIIDWAALMAALKSLPQDLLLIFETMNFLVEREWQHLPVDPVFALKRARVDRTLIQHPELLEKLRA